MEHNSNFVKLFRNLNNDNLLTYIHTQNIDIMTQKN